MALKPSLLDRLKKSEKTLGAGIYAAVLSLLILTVSGLIGVLMHLPWLFPSLGPTVMLFFESPEQPASRPTNTIVGHVTGLIAGAACFYAFDLQHSPSALVSGLTPLHVVAGALSVALTTLILTWIRMPHPPAGATTLIVSLGILTTPLQLLSLVGAVMFITVAGWSVNVLLGTRPAAKPARRPIVRPHSGVGTG